MSNADKNTSVDLTRQGFARSKPTTLVTTLGSPPRDLPEVRLDPYAVYIAKLRSENLKLKDQ